MNAPALIVCVGALSSCLSGCVSPANVRDTALDGLSLDRVDPGLLLPGSQLVITGQSFVDTDLGVTRLAFDGFLAQERLRFSLPATYISSSRLEIAVDDAFIAAVGGAWDGALDGSCTLEVRSLVDENLHSSPPLAVKLDLAATSTPSLSAVADGLTYVNQPIEVQGTGFLLGGKEGALFARIQGCYTPANQGACAPPVDVLLPAAPPTEFERTRALFPYATSISGIGPGHFEGTLVLVNRHASGVELSTSARALSFDVQRPMISGSSTTSASLGQYVFIDGGGFIGGAGNTDESTVLELVGTYTDRSGTITKPLDVVLVPEFVSGPRLRYVLDEGDALGSAIDLRKSSGTIVGTLRVTVQKGAIKLDGDPVAITLGISPVKQVIYLQFDNSYQSSLRLFGLRAADPLIRARAIALSQRIVQTINVEFRDQVPTDFALYSIVDIVGPDPSAKGLLGYDNTPGKDVGNQRLYDRIGGVNAQTQANGMAGYGGVFTESFFEFSNHPNDLAMRIPKVPDPVFDAIFDPFRPDTDGQELTATELATLDPEVLVSGDSCPAPSGNRSAQLSCAIWTLGNLIGSTMVHEVGHSLGLADPYGGPQSYHNPGDLPNRLMEIGETRPFTERALLGGDGPAEFCKTEYVYLRDILGTQDPDTTYARQPCD